MPHSEAIQFNDWLRASGTMEQGSVRKTMEDRILIKSVTVRDVTYYLFAVLDGHGGPEVAEHAMRMFVPTFEQALNGRTFRPTKFRQVIEATFHTLHMEAKRFKSGTTVSLLVVVHQHQLETIDLFVANVGDSTVYGVQDELPKPVIRKLSVDHNVNNASERKRVSQHLESHQMHISADGYITDSREAGINMSRSIGDHDFHPPLTATPTIRHVKTRYSTIILSSDGVWDVVSAAQVWDRLTGKKQRREWKNSALRVNTWRNDQFRQHDNTSMILVYIDWEKAK